MSMWGLCGTCCKSQGLELQFDPQDQTAIIEASCDASSLPYVQGSLPVLSDAPKAPEPELVETKADAKEPPNFTGDWVLSRLEGDFDAFLQDQGVGYMTRTMAKSMGYGVRKVFQVIKQEGDQIRITQTNPQRSVVVDLTVNGVEQDSTDPAEGKKIKVQPSWDGVALLLKSRAPDGKELPTARRFFAGEEMIMELTTPKGLVVKRIFSRKET
mmetsp:Transcript_43734/g.102048  ORF Transcript_43734/g.102048 Transcript_43734/m.102048 type:complete len:213 (+) Transcript_43734:90-728(+)